MKSLKPIFLTNLCLDFAKFIIKLKIFQDVDDDKVLKELSVHLGINVQDPKIMIKKSWNESFIQFQPGYFEKMTMIERELKNKSIIIGFSYYTMAIQELVYLSYCKKQLYV